jgi:MFS family permease
LIVAGLLGITVTSLCLFALSETRGSVALIYAVLFLDSTAQRIAWPARTALLPLLVPTELFESAIKWRTALTHASAMLGPALGGFLVAWRPSVAYAFSAAGSSMFALMLLTMRIPHATRIQSGRVLAQIGEGLRFVAENKLLLSSISLDLFAVLLGGADYLLPIYARDILNLKAVGLDPQQALGWLRAAPAAGAACVSLALAHLPPMRRAGASMLWAVAGFGVATLVFGLSRNFWLSLVMLAVSGGLDNVSIVVRQTLVQLAAPNEMRGRVSAVNALFIGSSNQLGGFESGLVAHFFGPVASVVSGGIGTLCIVAAWTGFFPSLRRFGTFSEAARQTP